MSLKLVAAIGCLALGISGAHANASSRHTSPPTKHWRMTTVGSGEDAAKRLCVLSVNEIKLSWPYAPTHVRFCINGDKDDLAAGRYDAYMELVGDGQIVTDEGLTVRVDNHDPAYIEGIGASDGSEDIIFLYEDVQVVRLLNSAKMLRIKATYFENGDQTAVFEVSGLPIHVSGLTTIESMDRDNELKSAASADLQAKVMAKYQCIADGGMNCDIGTSGASIKGSSDTAMSSAPATY